MQDGSGRQRFKGGPGLKLTQQYTYEFGLALLQLHRSWQNQAVENHRVLTRCALDSLQQAHSTGARILVED